MVGRKAVYDAKDKDVCGFYYSYDRWKNGLMDKWM